MEQTAKVAVRYEMSASVTGPDGKPHDLGIFGTRRFWINAVRWNLRYHHWRAFAMNLRDFPKTMVGRG